MVQGHHRADLLGESESIRPAAAAQPSSWPSLSRFASRLRARKRRPGIVAAMLRDIEGVSDSIMTVLATVVTTAAPLGTPTYTRRARQWLKIAPIAATLVAVAAGWWLYRSEIVNHVEMTIPPATRAIGDLAQVKQALQRERAEAPARELTMEQPELEIRAVLSRKASDEASQAQQAAQRSAAELRQARQQERDKAEKLARELATARRELESQASALTKAGDKAAPNQQLTGLRQALQQAEWLSAAYQELLAQERARSQGLEQQLAARRNDEELLAQERTRSQGLEQQLAARRNDEELLAQERTRSATGSLSDTSGPTPAPTTDNPPTTPLPTRNKPLMAVASADDKPATMAARPTAPEAPGNPDAPRLMARASLLLSQGDVGAARIVLDRAAETGSAPALFALAETYDPFILAAWRTFGTQGNAAKARELYAKAFAGGVQEANDRLNALRE
jgi:hypothetical protein